MARGAPSYLFWNERIITVTRILGLYDEFWPDNIDTLGPIRNFIADEELPDESRIFHYLHSGHLLFAAMGAATDVLGSGERIIASESLRTDGEWVWREDLPFYLARYHVALPAQFIDRVRAFDYLVPFLAPTEITAVADAMEELGII